MPGDLGRFLRTVGHLSPVQIAHRAKLRLRLALDRRAPFVPSPPPAGAPAPAPPLDLLVPRDRSAADAEAREIAGGRFRFLGSARDLGATPFPPPPDASLLWAYHLEYMDYLFDLALAGEWGAVETLVDARLAAEPSRHLAGLHPYPTARRVASWVRVLALAPAGLRGKLERGIWGFATRLRRRVEHDVGGNHILENGLALVLAGAAFRGAEAASMRRAGARILAAGARDQIRPDGSHFELSPAYHARVLSVLLEGALALAGRGPAPDAGYYEKVESMAGFLRGILDPEGALPLLGDTSREPSLDPARFLRAADRLLPGRSAGPTTGDRLYPDAGLVVLDAPERADRLLFDVGPTCPERLPAHGQADTFTFELHIGGVPFVVDPGLFEYAPGEMRDYCRSTRAHSTVTVDGCPSSEVWSSFRVGRRARVHHLVFSRGGRLASAVAEHDGYRHLGVRHRRGVTRLGDGVFCVADRLSGRGEHRFVSRIHLHPDAVIARLPAGVVRVEHRGRRLFVVPFGCGAPAIEPGWHCPRFGERHRTGVLAFEVFGGSAQLGYVLAGETETPPAVSLRDGFVRVEAGGRVLLGTLP